MTSSDPSDSTVLKDIRKLLEDQIKILIYMEQHLKLISHELRRRDL